MFFFDFLSVGQNYPKLHEKVDENFVHEKICTGLLIFKPRLLRETHCFSLFKIRYKNQSGHFLSLFININGSQVELNGLKNPLSRAKNTVTVRLLDRKNHNFAPKSVFYRNIPLKRPHPPNFGASFPSIRISMLYVNTIIRKTRSRSVD